MARLLAPATALAGGLLLALSGGLGRSDALASSASLGDLSVDGVQDLLQEWGLGSAFGAEFRAAGVDGWTLKHLAGGSKSNNNNKARRVHSLDRSRYPAAQFFHFDKLEARLLAATAGSAANEEAAEEAASASGGLRRSLAASDEYSGLSIKRNNSQITMGANADVALLRTGAAELTVDAAAVMAEGDVFVAGDLMVDGGLAVGDDVYPFFPTMEQSPGKTLDIKVRSRGFDDPCVSDGWTGLPACNSAIVVNGVAKSLSRGHTIMYFDHETGDLTDTGYWDTHGDSNATDEMVEWLEDIPIGDIVVVGTHDSAGEYEPFETFASLLTFGMDADLHDLVLRESLCLIGRRGSEAQGAFLPWEQFVTTPQYDGPANCSATIQTGSYAASVSGTYDITASQFNFNGMPVATHIWVRVLSIGFDDPGFGCVYTEAAGGCTGPNRASAVWVNGAKIPFDSNATTHRGHNFVVINQITGLVEDAKSFDSHGESASADEIAWFVGNITEGRIVVLAIHDAAGTYEHPESLLSLMAGHEFDADFELRESFCMIGRKGKVSTHWMTRFFNERFEGPSWCEATIPLLPPSYASAFETFDTEGEYVFGSRQLEAEEDAAVAAAEPE